MQYDSKQTFHLGCCPAWMHCADVNREPCFSPIHEEEGCKLGRILFACAISKKDIVNQLIPIILRLIDQLL